MFVDFSCPVENQGVIVKTNSKTGEPYALFKLFNLSDQVVTGVSFLVRAFDAYGGELGEIRVELSELNAQPKSFFAEKKAVSLKGYAEAKHITVDFLTVDFAEGESYTKSGDTTEIIINEPEYEERLRLISVAGSDAVCYAQDQGTYWVCVCGRPNVAAETECVRCGRNKKEVFDKFSSRGSLNKVIEKMEEDQQREEEKRLEEAAEKVKMRNKKIKKIALIAAAVAVCLVALGFSISHIINGVYILKGNKAAKEGDLVTAYSYYRMADSKKIGKVSEQVLGNSASNLYNSGRMASDEENIYYSGPDGVVYRESKTTGEKVKLGDVFGISLNVVDGWVYYLDAYTLQMIGRVKTDGSEHQHLVEVTDSYLSDVFVVGDNLYYLAVELRTDLTPEIQEQIARTGAMDMAYRNVLYRLEIGETTPEKVTDADVLQYVVYKDRIYYLDKDETAIFSMNLQGEDHKKIINGPVNAFEIINDVIYYQDIILDQETGFPQNATLEKAQPDGTYIESAIEGRTVITFSVVGEAVYYVGVDSMEDENAVLYKKTADKEEVLLEDCVKFNVCGDYIFYITKDGRYMKTKFDKTGYEEVLPDGKTAPTEETVAENAENLKPEE